jgi:hypothetical protein
MTEAKLFREEEERSTHLLLGGTAGANLQAAARERQRAVFGVQAFFDRYFGCIGLINLRLNLL